MQRVLGIAIALLLAGEVTAVAECPYANPGGADAAYVKSQYGKHIGPHTRVASTPHERAERSRVDGQYGKHVGSRSRRRGH